MKEKLKNEKERKIKQKSHIALPTSQNKGITLVALIITIIVLLILAVVAIRAVQGDGIITKAKEAKSNYSKAQAEEEIMLALNEWKILKNTSTETLGDFLVSKFGDDNVIDNGDDTYTVIVNDYEAIIDKDGNIVGEVEKFEQNLPKPIIDETSIKITTDGTTVPEEEGVAKGTPLQIYFEASIEGGEITTIVPDVPYTTSGTEMSKEFTIVGKVNGKSRKIKQTISVEKYYPIDHSEKIVQTIAKTGVFDNANIAEVREGNIPIPTGFTYVKGDSKGGAVITSGTSEFVWIPVKSTIAAYKLNSSKDREPDVVTGVTPSSTVDSASGKNYDAIPINLTKVLEGEYASTQTAASFKSQLTAEFNKMAESVNKYHGFYVGRYETSLDGTTAQSKAGKTPMKSINWYAMYKYSKTYAPESSSKAVVSQMIWGSQWTAMIDYIKTTADASHATATTNVGHTSSEFTSKPYKTGGTNYTEVYTGTVTYNDKAANIYDLEGNVMEWTQEANGIDCRVLRGGCYSEARSPSPRLISYDPTMFSSDVGSRLALYIK